MLMIGQGVHDRAALLYPVIILVAALLLDRRLLVATTALCVLSATVVVRLEAVGCAPDALLGPPRLAARRGHDDHPRRHRGGRAPPRRRRRARDGPGARPGRAPGGGEPRARGEQRRARALHLRRVPRPQEPAGDHPGLPLLRRAGRPGRGPRPPRGGRWGASAPPPTGWRSCSTTSSSCRAPAGSTARTRTCPSRKWCARRARPRRGGSRRAASGSRSRGALPVVRGDRQRLVELVQNLLENAAKFMGDRRDPEVRIGARDDGGRARSGGRSTSATTASASTPRTTARVFELFHRLDPRDRGDRPRARPGPAHRGDARRPDLGGVGRRRARLDLLLHVCPVGRRRAGQRAGTGAVSRAVSHSSKPSRLVHSVAHVAARAVGSGTVIPSSVTRTPVVSVFTRSREIAR